MRGSRKHVLDWVESPTFDRELETLLVPIAVTVPDGAERLPRSHAEPREARLETFGPLAIPDHPVWPQLRSWWLKHEAGANTPNWDLAVACDIDGRRGLCLVEAKANVPELSSAGKAVNKRASTASRENSERIGAALREASVALTQAGYESDLEISRSYQLANRLAFAWRLASGGIPVVLLYLGFTGDTGIADAGEPLRDGDHWDALFAEYLAEIAPGIRPNERVAIGAGFWVLSRSRKVSAPSAPAPSRHRTENLVRHDPD